jgi:hypothetical protein
MMTEQEAILISVILNMALDGKCDLSQLSPVVAEFVEGAVLDYYADPDDNEVLYWYAHEALETVPKRKLH